MGHFAKVLNGKVIEVIVAEPEFFETFTDDTPGKWIQTSYNTVGGVHLSGGEPLRKNFAGIGYDYDAIRDAFIPPKPHPSWVLNEDTCLWEAPVDQPTTDDLNLVPDLLKAIQELKAENDALKLRIENLESK